jgi:hypothetical protein
MLFCSMHPSAELCARLGENDAGVAVGKTIGAETYGGVCAVEEGLGKRTKKNKGVMECVKKQK